MPEYKLLVLGTAGVGKSALTIQFVNNKFIEIYNPTVEDSYRKQITIDDQYCILNILDTAGIEDFSAVRQHYTITGHGFLIVYSITSKQSFSEIDAIYQDICRIKDTTQVPIVIVANKCDLEPYRQVPRSEGEEYSRKNGLPFLEVSAKSNINVNEAFFAVVREIYKCEKKTAESAPRNNKKKLCKIM